MPNRHLPDPFGYLYSVMRRRRGWTIAVLGDHQGGQTQSPRCPRVSTDFHPQAVVQLSPGEDRDFHRQFNQKVADAYTWDLCGAPSAALSGYFLWQDRPG
jgi:hypothetical protein